MHYQAFRISTGFSTFPPFSVYHSQYFWMWLSWYLIFHLNERDQVAYTQLTKEEK